MNKKHMQLILTDPWTIPGRNVGHTTNPVQRAKDLAEALCTDKSSHDWLWMLAGEGVILRNTKGLHVVLHANHTAN